MIYVVWKKTLLKVDFNIRMLRNSRQKKCSRFGEEKEERGMAWRRNQQPQEGREHAHVRVE